MTPDQELEERSGVSDVPRSCRNCGHEAHYHSGEFVDMNTYMPACCAESETDRLSEMDIVMCGCRNYEAEGLEDILAREHPEEI
jgi:hypothetical protein